MAVVAWVLGGSVAMYVVALSLAEEMEGFPGGGEAFARSVSASVEAMRILRWPADRLDTLGGYLSYHNVTLFTLLLSIYAAVQGARAIRGGEEQHSLEEILATGRSRTAVLLDRTLGFVATMALIALGLGFGVAASLAAGGEPDTGGSLITMAVSGLCALVAYALGLLLSQVTASSRTAGGLAALTVSVLYVLTNVWEELGPFGAVRFLSPFYYANASRALVPGHGLDVGSTLVLVAVTSALVGLATVAFVRRDYASPLWTRSRQVEPDRPARVQRPLLRSTWRETVLRKRAGLLGWGLGTAAYGALLALMTPGVIDVWEAFESWVSIAGGRADASPEAQYLSLLGEIITLVIAAYVVTQAAGWVADLEQGRVEVVLAAPLSWSRLVWERLLAVSVGVCVITAGALVGLSVAAATVDVPVEVAGLARTALDCLLLGLALGAVAALVVAIFRTGPAVIVLAVFLGASYLVGILVPLLDWPEWVNRLSVFGAFGHPYLAWPPWSGTVLLLVLALPGGLAAAAVAERTPKVS